MQEDGHQGLHTRVADALRLAIVRGAYPPGAALSELALADELRVSRTPVREALKQLATEGLVRIVPRVGTFVTEPTEREVAELDELREAFEGLAARLVAQRRDPVGLDALAAAAGASARAAAAGDLAAAGEADRAFAEALVEAAGSEKLLQTYRWHANQLVGRHDADADAAGAARAAAAHAAVLERVRAGDADGAEWTMRDHAQARRRALAVRAARMRASSEGGAAG